MDAPPPPPPLDAALDAAPIDACTCGSGTILATKISYLTGQREIFDGVGQGSGCLDLRGPAPLTYGTLLGGSYVLQPGPSESKSAITDIGVSLPFLPFLGQPNENENVSWFGAARAFERDDGHQMYTTAACIDTAVDGGVECARRFHVSHDVEYAWVPPGGVVDASARCAAGVLVGGGCSVDGLRSTRVRVLRAGIDPADPSRWLCSWRSHDAAEDIAVSAQAFCLEETIPEACDCCPPLGDSIAVRQETQPLGPGTNRLQVTCEPDELLLLGNCMLDGADSATLANVTMFRFGFYPGDDDTWGCSWNNPDAVTATAIATALCLPRGER